MRLPSFSDFLRAQIPDFPPVIVFPSLVGSDAPDPETVFQPWKLRTSVTAADSQNPKAKIAAEAAADCAFADPFQQSKHTTICSEMSAASSAPNPKLEARNSEQQPAAPPPRRWNRYARQLSRSVPLTEEIGYAMYDAILRTGISDARAGHLFHVRRTVVSQWKQEDPEFADFLQSARLGFASVELTTFVNAPARNARHGVRKSMWLLEYSMPEKWGRRPATPTPSSRPKPAPLARESEFPHLFQQSKVTTNCSEIRHRTNPSEVADEVLTDGRVEQGEKGCPIDLSLAPSTTQAAADPNLLHSLPAATTPGFHPANPELGTRNPKLPRRKRPLGRPTLLTEEIADAMYEAILRGGISDSRAASLLNVSRVTVCRWKQEDPIFAEFLEIARSKFVCAQIKKVRHTPVPSAQQGARNARWLLEYSNPERLGRRPRKLPTSSSSPRRRQTPATAKESESSNAPHVGKDTSICSETIRSSDAIYPQLETRNPPSVQAAKPASATLSRQSKVTTKCSETTPGFDLGDPKSETSVQTSADITVVSEICGLSHLRCPSCAFLPSHVPPTRRKAE